MSNSGRMPSTCLYHMLVARHACLLVHAVDLSAGQYRARARCLVGDRKTFVDTNVRGTYKLDNRDDSIKWSFI